MRVKGNKVNTLDGRERYKLMQLVEAEYAKQSLSDTDFAAKATIDLGFEVTRANVQGAREALEIESTRDVQARTKAEPQTRLDAIERRLDTIEAWIKAFDAQFKLG